VTLAGLLEKLAAVVVVAAAAAVETVAELAEIVGISSNHGLARQSVQPLQHVLQDHHAGCGRPEPLEAGW
jgi:hypothetical protein